MTETPTTPQVPRQVLWGCLVALILAVAVAALMAPRWLRSSLERTQSELPVIAQVPEFSLTDRDGEIFSSQALLGRPWVADFVFTRCQVSCPVMTVRMAELKPQLPPGVQLVSVSVDPEHDTPEVLAAYAEKYEAGDDWHFLTGSREVIYPLIRGGFKLGVQPADPEEEGSSAEPITHSTRFVLVDAQGGIRGYYDAFDKAALGRLLRDVRRLGS